MYLLDPAHIKKRGVNELCGYLDMFWYVWCANVIVTSEHTWKSYRGCGMSSIISRLHGIMYLYLVTYHTHTIHIPYTYNVHAMYIPWTYHVIQCAYHAHTMYIQCAYHAHTIHIPYTPYTYNVHTITMHIQ